MPRKLRRRFTIILHRNNLWNYLPMPQPLTHVLCSGTARSLSIPWHDNNTWRIFIGLIMNTSSGQPGFAKLIVSPNHLLTALVIIYYERHGDRVVAYNSSQPCTYKI